MFYAELNDELSSSYSRNTQKLASITSESQLPVLGLKAGSLLDDRQMKKLHEIRNRHLKGDQKSSFLRD
ncbi:hypothetical protein [Leptospira sp. GIMC2001]|uniref:hypothetical protein n=1 Tax=Leptospira sp. GIMC2001 TaxID=1513297 RepID=UPI002349FB33|nr:hypothetical protein [Leptospira sp. GIMC2001]WCL49902.1 hypothetical protein O4O04_03540 [Leptospira sp. GIMC2001]